MNETMPDWLVVVLFAVCAGVGYTAGFLRGRHTERRAWWLVAQGLKSDAEDRT